MTNVVMHAELVGEDVAMHELEELVEQLSRGRVVGVKDRRVNDLEGHDSGGPELAVMSK